MRVRDCPSVLKRIGERDRLVHSGSRKEAIWLKEPWRLRRWPFPCGRALRARPVRPSSAPGAGAEQEVEQACLAVWYAVRSWQTKRMAGRAALRKSTRNRWELAPDVLRDRVWLRQQWKLAADTFEQADAELAFELEEFGGAPAPPLS